MVEDIELLVTLQGLDLRAGELKKEIALLPKDIAAIEKTLEGHRKRLEANKATLAVALKERKQADLDVQANKQKVEKLREQMMSAKTNEQYRAFQTEIEYCEQAIKKIEDRVLEMMDGLEALEKNVKAADAALKAENGQVEAQKSEARNRSAEDQAKLAAIMAERKGAMEKLTGQGASLYERLCRRYPAGPVITDATKGQCGACHLTLRPQLFQDLRRRDKLIVCESCGRLVFYNPPAIVDEPPMPAAPVQAATRTRQRREAATPATGPAGRRVDMS